MPSADRIQRPEASTAKPPRSSTAVPRMSFASNLRAAMDERRVTQTELVALTGVGKSSLSQYLSGKNIPKEAVKQKLAEALETSVGFLDGDHVFPDAAPDVSALKNVPVEQAARLLGKSKQFVRVALQRSAVPFGFAVKVSGSKWSYHISPRKLNDYLGGAS